MDELQRVLAEIERYLPDEAVVNARAEMTDSPYAYRAGAYGAALDDIRRVVDRARPAAA